MILPSAADSPGRKAVATGGSVAGVRGFGRR